MTIQIKNVCKSFNDQLVLNNINLELANNHIYCLMGPSGMGKTTLLRIILGLETKDSGAIKGIKRGEIATMFQENRLCEELTPIDNVMLVIPGKASRAAIRNNLAQILPADCLNQPVSELSGGMKRRVALARTMNYPSKMIIMDEPFTGLDVNTKKNVIHYLRSMRNGRITLITTHSEEDVSLLDAHKISLEDL